MGAKLSKENEVSTSTTEVESDLPWYKLYSAHFQLLLTGEDTLANQKLHVEETSKDEEEKPNQETEIANGSVAAVAEGVITGEKEDCLNLEVTTGNSHEDAIEVKEDGVNEEVTTGDSHDSHASSPAQLDGGDDEIRVETVELDVAEGMDPWIYVTKNDASESTSEIAGETEITIDVALQHLSTGDHNLVMHEVQVTNQALGTPPLTDELMKNSFSSSTELQSSNVEADLNVCEENVEAEIVMEVESGIDEIMGDSDAKIVVESECTIVASEVTEVEKPGSNKVVSSKLKIVLQPSKAPSETVTETIEQQEGVPETSHPESDSMAKGTSTDLVEPVSDAVTDDSDITLETPSVNHCISFFEAKSMESVDEVSPGKSPLSSPRKSPLSNKSPLSSPENTANVAVQVNTGDIPVLDIPVLEIGAETEKQHEIEPLVSVETHESVTESESVICEAEVVLNADLSLQVAPLSECEKVISLGTIKPVETEVTKSVQADPAVSDASLAGCNEVIAEKVGTGIQVDNAHAINVVEDVVNTELNGVAYGQSVALQVICAANEKVELNINVQEEIISVLADQAIEAHESTPAGGVKVAPVVSELDVHLPEAAEVLSKQSAVIRIEDKHELDTGVGPIASVETDSVNEQIQENTEPATVEQHVTLMTGVETPDVSPPTELEMLSHIAAGHDTEETTDVLPVDPCTEVVTATNEVVQMRLSVSVDPTVPDPTLSGCNEVIAEKLEVDAGIQIENAHAINKVVDVVNTKCNGVVCGQSVTEVTCVQNENAELDANVQEEIISVLADQAKEAHISTPAEDVKVTTVVSELDVPLPEAAEVLSESSAGKGDTELDTGVGPITPLDTDSVNERMQVITKTEYIPVEQHVTVTTGVETLDVSPPTKLEKLSHMVADQDTEEATGDACTEVVTEPSVVNEVAAVELSSVEVEILVDKRKDAAADEVTAPQTSLIDDVVHATIELSNSIEQLNISIEQLELNKPCANASVVATEECGNTVTCSEQIIGTNEIIESEPLLSDAEQAKPCDVAVVDVTLLAQVKVEPSCVVGSVEEVKPTLNLTLMSPAADASLQVSDVSESAVVDEAEVKPVVQFVAPSAPETTLADSDVVTSSIASSSAIVVETTEVVTIETIVTKVSDVEGALPEADGTTSVVTTEETVVVEIKTSEEIRPEIIAEPDAPVTTVTPEVDDASLQESDIAVASSALEETAEVVVTVPIASTDVSEVDGTLLQTDAAITELSVTTVEVEIETSTENEGIVLEVKGIDPPSAESDVVTCPIVSEETTELAMGPVLTTEVPVVEGVLPLDATTTQLPEVATEEMSEPVEGKTNEDIQPEPITGVMVTSVISAINTPLQESDVVAASSATVVETTEVVTMNAIVTKVSDVEGVLPESDGTTSVVTTEETVIVEIKTSEEIRPEIIAEPDAPVNTVAPVVDDASLQESDIAVASPALEETAVVVVTETIESTDVTEVDGTLLQTEAATTELSVTTVQVEIERSTETESIVLEVKVGHDEESKITDLCTHDTSETELVTTCVFPDNVEINAAEELKDPKSFKVEMWTSPILESIIKDEEKITCKDSPTEETNRKDVTRIDITASSEETNKIEDVQTVDKHLISEETNSTVEVDEMNVAESTPTHDECITFYETKSIERLESAEDKASFEYVLDITPNDK